MSQIRVWSPVYVVILGSKTYDFQMIFMSMKIIEINNRDRTFKNFANFAWD